MKSRTAPIRGRLWLHSGLPDSNRLYRLKSENPPSKREQRVERSQAAQSSLLLICRAIFSPHQGRTGPPFQRRETRCAEPQFRIAKAFFSCARSAEFLFRAGRRCVGFWRRRWRHDLVGG
jgi:hypothetical protein